ncbi:hypothetical protein cypCar_00038509 [Cyprinus carpio]|nr:hypothetical protein cypCar_00038509 [Cyprinus carpio]
MWNILTKRKALYIGSFTLMRVVALWSEMAKDGAAKLSKNVLRMKFMQRGLDAELKQQLEEEEKRIVSDEHWSLDLPELTAKEGDLAG